MYTDASHGVHILSHGAKFSAQRKGIGARWDGEHRVQSGEDIGELALSAALRVIQQSQTCSVDDMNQLQNVHMDVNMTAAATAAVTAVKTAIQDKRALSNQTEADTVLLAITHAAHSTQLERLSLGGLCISDDTTFAVFGSNSIKQTTNQTDQHAKRNVMKTNCLDSTTIAPTPQYLKARWQWTMNLRSLDLSLTFSLSPDILARLIMVSGNARWNSPRKAHLHTSEGTSTFLPMLTELRVARSLRPGERLSIEHLRNVASEDGRGTCLTVLDIRYVPLTIPSMATAAVGIIMGYQLKNPENNTSATLEDFACKLPLFLTNEC